LACPIKDHIYLVPHAIREFIDHTNQVHLLIVVISKAEECNVHPRNLSEVSILGIGRNIGLILEHGGILNRESILGCVCFGCRRRRRRWGRNCDVGVVRLVN